MLCTIGVALNLLYSYFTTEVSYADDEKIAGGDLKPGSDANLETGMMDVQAGDSVSLAIHAPNGNNTGSFSWDLGIRGRQRADRPMNYTLNLQDNFPDSNTPPPDVTPVNVWADLVQMLWASNAFHYID